MFFAGIFWFR